MTMEDGYKICRVAEEEEVEEAEEVEGQYKEAQEVSRDRKRGKGDEALKNHGTPSAAHAVVLITLETAL
jgi:hypothetical protein